MSNLDDYHLSVAEVARHYQLSERTVRTHLKSGALNGVRVGGLWRCSWRDVWKAEKGPAPRGTGAARYCAPLLKKKDLARKWGMCERTVERWITSGLPTRNVFGSVRIAPADADEWMGRMTGSA
jgi:hypothetical protein